MTPNKRFCNFNTDKKLFTYIIVILFSFISFSCDFVAFKKESNKRQSALENKLDSLRIEQKKIEDDLEAAQQVLDNYAEKDSIIKTLVDSVQVSN